MVVMILRQFQNAEKVYFLLFRVSQYLNIVLNVVDILEPL